MEIRKSGDDAVRCSRVASAPRLRNIGLIVIFLLAALLLSAREKNANDYGVGLVVNVPFPEAEVVQVVQEVIQNGLIRGTKEYNKDEYITGANSATFTRVFPRWTEGGKVFYKVRLKALDPRNFRDSSDLGTLAVRYIVQPLDEKHAVLRIDARFVEDFRRSSHPSNGSVESAEYKDIHDHLEALELMRAQTVEAEKEKQEQAARQVSAPIDRPPADVAQAVPEHSVRTDATSSRDAEASPQTLEQRVQDLRRQVQRLVKAPGAPLQSAPFHTATTLRSLPTGTEVLIVVSTPYWYGVETQEGQHGWILRDELELIP